MHLIKSFLNVWMARSAAFTLWLFGSMNWISQPWDVTTFLMADAGWLSVTLKVGLYPLLASLSNTAVKAMIILSPFVDGITSAKM